VVQGSESLAREEEMHTFSTDAEIERFINAAGFRCKRVLQRELVRQFTCELDFALPNLTDNSQIVLYTF